MNLFRSIVIALLFPASSFVLGDDSQSEIHPLENFARSVLETYSKKDFPAFYQHTVFAMQEDHYKNFLLGIRNDKIRNQLTNGKWKKWEKDADFDSSLILRDFKNGALTKENASEKLEQIQRKKSDNWKTACLQEWRKSFNRLKALGRGSIQEEAFLAILKGAEKESIQWETVKVKAIEVLHQVSANKTNFVIDGSPSPILHWQPGLSYRMQFNATKTHGRSFRFSTMTEGPILYEEGTQTEIGSGDLIVDFNLDEKYAVSIRGREVDSYTAKEIFGLFRKNEIGVFHNVKVEGRDMTMATFIENYQTGELPEQKKKIDLFYFCPDQKGMGNKILFSYGEQEPKLNVLITFTYGNQVRDYRILLRDCLPIPSSTSAEPSDTWNRWLLFERPVWLGMVLGKAASE